MKKRKKKDPRGRPYMGDKARRYWVHIRITKAERAELLRLAKERGVSVGGLLMQPFREGGHAARVSDIQNTAQR